MTVYLSADSHFSHTNILKFCNRPFANIDEMNSALVTNWNAVVTDDDSVWHLGDFCWHGSEHFFHRLNGKKHLIIGNHDGRKTLTLPWASQPRDYHEMKLIDGEGISHELVLSHYPFEEWNRYYKGSIHLYGHVHARKLNDCSKPRFDVGVDNCNFAPITLDQILARLK
jgi:calcineurin-like phosphoesterase family protein